MPAADKTPLNYSPPVFSADVYQLSPETMKAAFGKVSTTAVHISETDARGNIHVHDVHHSQTVNQNIFNIHLSVNLLPEELRKSSGGLGQALAEAIAQGKPLSPELAGMLRDFARLADTLLARLQPMPGDSPVVQESKQQSAEALRAGNLDRVEAPLKQAVAQEQADARQLSAQALQAALEQVRFLRLAYSGAVMYFWSDIDLTPAGMEEVQSRYLNEAAEVWWKAGAYRAAEVLLTRALRLRQRWLGEHSDSELLAQSLSNLAVLYDNQGRYAEAEPLFRRALEIYEKVLGAGHPDTANSLNNLAALYDNQGRYAEAEPLFRRALEISEKVLGAWHPNTAVNLNNLAELCRAQGRYAEAEPLHRRALDIREKVLGAWHPDTALSLNNLAWLYQAQGRYAEAEPLHRRALDIREKAQGAWHPDTAMSLNNLALLYKHQGRYAEAEPLHRRALEIFEKMLGAEHPHTRIARDNLQRLLDKMAAPPAGEEEPSPEAEAPAPAEGEKPGLWQSVKQFWRKLT